MGCGSRGLTLDQDAVGIDVPECLGAAGELCSAVSSSIPDHRLKAAIVGIDQRISAASWWLVPTCSAFRMPSKALIKAASSGSGSADSTSQFAQKIAASDQCNTKYRYLSIAS
jgi:hypothetical protein